MWRFRATPLQTSLDDFLLANAFCDPLRIGSHELHEHERHQRDPSRGEPGDGERVGLDLLAGEHRAEDGRPEDRAEDRSEQDCRDGLPRLEIFAASGLRVNEREPRAQKRQAEESQEGGSAFGWLGHSLILGAFKGTNRKL